MELAKFLQANSASGSCSKHLGCKLQSNGGDSLALIARSAGWVRLQGWRPRLCTALRTISFCPSALPNTAFAPPSGWLSSGAQDGCRQCAGYVLLHLGRCLGSAFQARIPRFTLIRVLLDISLLQHSPSNLSENCWVYLQNISSIQPPSPLPLLPAYCQPLACHLDYWSQFLTGLPASAPVLSTAARVVLYKCKSDHVTAQNPPMASHLTK